jgi:rod shape-determining protein MreD
MNNQIIKFSLLFTVAVLTQVLFLNQLQISRFINPFFYVIFIILLPTNLPRYLLLLLGFLLGITIDVFSNTPGIHASATVFISFIRPFVVNPSNADDKERIVAPTLHNTSLAWFLKYAAILVLLHHLFLFYIEVFSFSGFFNTFIRFILSSAASLIIIVFSQFILFRK